MPKAVEKERTDLYQLYGLVRRMPREKIAKKTLKLFAFGRMHTRVEIRPESTLGTCTFHVPKC